MNSKTQDQIEKYLTGALSIEETKIFELKLKEDFELAEEVKLYKYVNNGLDEESWFDTDIDKDNLQYQRILNLANSGEGQKLQNDLLEAKESYFTKQRLKKQRTRIYVAISSAAAAVIFLLMTTVLSPSQSSDELFVTHFTNNDMPSLVSRSSNNANNLSKGIQAYHNKDYQESINYFENYFAESNEINPLVYSYSGWAYAYTGDEDQAFKDFDKLANSDHLDSSKGLWFNALLHLKLNETEEAKSTLKKIVVDENNFKFAEAKEMLADLK